VSEASLARCTCDSAGLTHLAFSTRLREGSHFNCRSFRTVVRTTRASDNMSTMPSAKGAPCTVRVGKTRDAQNLSNFAAEVFRKSFGGQTARADLDLYIAQYFTQEKQHAELSDPAMITLLAMHNRALVGYSQVRVSSQPEKPLAGRPAEIKRFYVTPEWQGRGVAQVLLQETIARIATTDCDRVWLSVWKQNPRALAFYRKSGFAVMGEQNFQVGTDVQRDFVMERTELNGASSA
jgi:ribosomal protein S18 acetylase RimI-like enzyme